MSENITLKKADYSSNYCEISNGIGYIKRAKKYPIAIFYQSDHILQSILLFLLT
ncbi:hypothetical protein FD41_GL000285 [Lentilactobacillus farraginis DSM 18382 = JCM 14108]|uniref:Uncharacterized protein n=1 Tax=Lentilactobacillus farraginis DSM 18382 = JCM 14108 TaxID=1423743 RepID=A0A0R1VWN5_9LACO|nr:hypothetical protein FD41_GL000285 [Lentilactobacillus farraginis DSM 18382 = JCM 14108]